MKKCSKCGVEKNDSDFAVDALGEKGHGFGIEGSDEMPFLNFFQIAGNGHRHFDALRPERIF